MKKSKVFVLCLSVCLLFIFSFIESKNSNPKVPDTEKEVVPPVVFTAIGDVPYNDVQRDDLISLIARHNIKGKSEFVIHVGDIKAGSTPCDESIYQDVSAILKEIKIPTFIILGDNEYNDCDDPIQGLHFWNGNFLHFNENWQFPYAVSYQETRNENFCWSENKVLFIGINLVGSNVHDVDEWQTRLSDNGNWVKHQMEKHKDNTKASVIFGHANMNHLEPDKFNAFTDVFRAAAAVYEKPILYLQGDGHSWLQDRPWEEKNILRVQIDGGSKAVQVTVDTSKDNPFLFDKNFLD